MPETPQLRWGQTKLKNDFDKMMLFLFESIGMGWVVYAYKVDATSITFVTTLTYPSQYSEIDAKVLPNQVFAIVSEDRVLTTFHPIYRNIMEGD